MTAPILVVGATGTVGAALVRELLAAGWPVRAASTRPERLLARFGPDVEAARFDVTRPQTWPLAYDGVERMFLLRPPQTVRVERTLVPAVATARAAGVRRVVFLSVQGAARNRLLPHRRVEKALERSGLEWTFLRASYFFQNLVEVHAADLSRGRIVVPAGAGRTSFVDARDVAAMAARALGEEGHAGRAYTPTGPAALTYSEVARELTDVLGRGFRYTSPSPWRYAQHARRELGLPAPMVAVTLALYSAARLGLAAGLTDDVPRVLGRAATDVRRFAADYAGELGGLVH